MINKSIPNGAIIKFSDKPEVYLVDNGKLRHFTKEVKTANGQSIFNSMVVLDPFYRDDFEIDERSISNNIPFDPPNTSWQNKITPVSSPTNQMTPNTSSSDWLKPESQKVSSNNQTNQINTDPTILDNIDKKGFLLKFSSDPDQSGPFNTQTVFLVDTTSKKLRPFLNAEAFNNFFKNIGRPEINIDTVQSSGLIKTYTPNVMNEGFALTGYSFSPNDQGVQNDGTFVDATPEEGGVDTNKILQAYGQQKSTDAVNEAMQKLFDLVINNKEILDANGITQEVMNGLSRDQKVFYINALGFGGYDIPSIIQDLKRKQLIANGENQYTNVKVIDAEKTANQYYNTTEGKTAYNDPNLDVTGMYGNISLSSLRGLSIYYIPQEVTDALNPEFDFTTPEGKALLDSIDTSYYDILTQQLEAKTEQDKVLADYNWKVFRDDLAKQYGIKLSDNALTAWNELQSLRGTVSERGLGDSGIFQEMQDKYLQSVRRSNQQLRDEKISTEKKNEIEYLIKSGTPEQINTFLATNPELEKYFKPDAELVNYFSPSNLKILFPNADEDALKRYSESLIDSESGLFRSQLYQKLWENKYGPIKVPEEGIASAIKQTQIGSVEYDDNGNVIGGSGAAYKAALERQKKEEEFAGSVYEGGTYKKPEEGITPDTPVSTPTSWIDPATGKSTPVGVGIPQTEKSTQTPAPIQIPSTQNIPSYREGGIYKSATSPEMFVYKGGALNWIQDENTWKNLYGNKPMEGSYELLPTTTKGLKFGPTINTSNYKSYL